MHKSLSIKYLRYFMAPDWSYYSQVQPTRIRLELDEP